MRTPEQLERKNRRQREKYAANREAERQRSREQYAERKDEIQARRRARYHADPEYRAKNLAASKRWVEENRDHANATHRAWYGENRDRINEQQAAARAADPERHRAYVRKHKAKNPDEIRRRDREIKQARRASGDPVIRAHIRADRARRRGVECDEVARQYMAILIEDPCSYCGGPTDTIDHIVPLAEQPDGDWSNLTAACVSCNASKNASPLLSWMLTKVILGS